MPDHQFALNSNAAYRITGTTTSISASAPEPGSIALAACGALPLLGMVIRRRQSRTA